MSEFGKCPKCGEYAYLRTHQCKPIWHAVCAEDLEDADEHELWREIHANSARDAAEIYAEVTDQEAAIFSDSAPQLIAVRAQDGTLSHWEVRAELEPVYTACAIQECWPEGE